MLGTSIASLLIRSLETNQTYRKTDMSIKLVKAAVAGVSLLALAALPAKANTIDYSLSAINFSSPPGPYGDVLVNLTDSTHATITFTSANGFSFVDGSSAAVN